MLFERTILYSLYTPYPVYFKMGYVSYVCLSVSDALLPVPRRGLGAAPRAAAVGGELRGRLREGDEGWRGSVVGFCSTLQCWVDPGRIVTGWYRFSWGSGRDVS